MNTNHEAHLATNLGVEVPSPTIDRPAEHLAAMAHVDEHAREELLEGFPHPEHGTNFGLVLEPDTEHQ